jgi:transcriptional regulator with XRE-family HTH domain
MKDFKNMALRAIDAKKTGERIRTLRKEKGIKVEDLCVALGVSEQSIYKWQRGACIPTVDHIMILGEIYDVPIEQIVIMTGEEE